MLSGKLRVLSNDRCDTGNAASWRTKHASQRLLYRIMIGDVARRMNCFPLTACHGRRVTPGTGCSLPVFPHLTPNSIPQPANQVPSPFTLLLFLFLLFAFIAFPTKQSALPFSDDRAKLFGFECAFTFCWGTVIFYAITLSTVDCVLPAHAELIVCVGCFEY